MTELETFCKLKIAEARRDIRNYKKAPSFDMEISHKRALAYGLVSAYSKVLIKLKQLKKQAQ